MKKLKMARGVALTFEEGCNKYLENCRQRNLREGTIEHYRQSYMQFYKFFDPKMPIEDIDEQTYKDYVLHLKSTLDNDVSINSYLRDLITTFHFFIVPLNQTMVSIMEEYLKYRKSNKYLYRKKQAVSRSPPLVLFEPTYISSWLFSFVVICPS